MRRTLLGVAVLILALPGCSFEDGAKPAAALQSTGAEAAGASGLPPVPESSEGIGGAPPPPGSLDGKRQVFLLPRLDDRELPDSVVAVTAAGRLQVTDDYGDRALFVPVPKGGGAEERLIKTARLRDDGKPLCLQVQSNGPDPLTVITAGCDPTSPAQLFTFDASGEDDEGRATYQVRNRDAFLAWHPLGGLGLVAEKLRDSELETTFSLHDQGAAALPKA